MGVDYPNLDGHVALVTGGRRGIGRGIARRLAAQGAGVVIGVESRSEDHVDETIALWKSLGRPLGVLEVDLVDDKARSDAVARAGEFFGPIDILVNNAAGNPRTPPSAMPLADRRQMFELNLHAPIDLVQQALPGMRERRWGRILNILSETIHQSAIPYSGPAQHTHQTAVYGASKSALERYTLGLAAELHGSNIHVNGVYPQRVCVTEANSESALAALRRHPDWGEGLEVMAEAAMLLIAGSVSGVSMSSRRLLQLFQQPLHALDGTTVIGDAHTLPTLE